MVIMGFLIVASYLLYKVKMNAWFLCNLGKLVTINQFDNKMDIGRLIIIPVFGLLMAANITSFYGGAKALELASTINVATLIHRLLLVFFYALLVYLYFTRSVAMATTESFITKTIAVLSTFLPFAIPLFGKPSDHPQIILLANLATVLGIVLAIYSLRALGRNFSIIPQARALVQTGPYRLVRHPIYLGELIAVIGVVLGRMSVSAIAVLCFFTALLIYRALQEEKLLAHVFPEYRAISLKKARFIPGVF
jgi:protein-S-isoprenylcysteine O-methyltransferase Ste14